MLFDLKGRRKRVVQVTYIGLALLMGGGLVLTGVGSSASGGLLDALVGNDSGTTSDAKKPLQKRVDTAEARLAQNPKDQAALIDLVRAHFALAGLEQSDDGQTVSLTDTGKQEMTEAEQAWGRYIDTNPKQIDPGIAATVLAIYDSGVVPLPSDQKVKNARYVRPAADLAEQTNTKEAYIKLVQVATKAGDTRTAALAERKALSFAASKDEKATIKEQIDAIKQSAAPAPAAGGNGAAPPAGGP
jgi:hypothetical protein